MVGSENLAKFEVTLHRGYRDKGSVEKKVETIEARNSEEVMEIALERTEGTSWRIDKIEEVK
jgi:hypothetical protein